MYLSINEYLFIMKYIITESQYKLINESIAFDELYKKTYPTMFRQVCMKYANGDYDLASDFCQLGYVKVHSQLHKYSGEGSIEGWVRRVISNTILNEFRGKKRIETSSDYDFERLDVEDEPEERIEDIDFMGKYSANDIKKAIASLAEGYLFVFYQYFYKDKSHKEIADMLGIDEGTSRSQLAKAKKKVKEYLENLKR